MTKLAVRLRKGKFEVITKELPDLAEAKRLWMQGKSAQWILERQRRKRDGKEE